MKQKKLKKIPNTNQLWISVKDRLPEFMPDLDDGLNDSVHFSPGIIMLMENRDSLENPKYYQVTGCYTSRGWYYVTISSNGQHNLKPAPFPVTHWMPIIKLPINTEINSN